MTTNDDKDAQKFFKLMQLQARFDEDPSIENYIAFRRFAPGCDTEIYRFAGVDPLQFLGQELKNGRLDRWLVCGALGGDDRDVDELCLQLMERLTAAAMTATLLAERHFRRSCRSFDCCDDGSSSTALAGTEIITCRAR
jgi:hypothetical protein